MNKTVKNNGVVVIYLNGKHGEGKKTVVDVESYVKHNLGKYNWLCTENERVIATVKGKPIHMSHLIMGKPKKGYVVDHINRKPLDNRKSNLRHITYQENNYNRGINYNATTDYKGVSIKNGKYRGQLRIGTKKVHLGSFITSEEAAYAYQLAAEMVHGEYSTATDVSMMLSNSVKTLIENKVYKKIAKVYMQKRAFNYADKSKLGQLISKFV